MYKREKERERLKQIQMGLLTTWNKNPKGVHENEVPPVIIRFRAGIRSAMIIILHHARRIIENIAVELTHRDKHLGWMAVWGFGYNHPRCQIAKWTPCKLQQMSALKVISLEWNMYGCDCLHAKHEWLYGHVSRIGQCIFLPELTK